MQPMLNYFMYMQKCSDLKSDRAEGSIEHHPVGDKTLPKKKNYIIIVKKSGRDWESIF